ncbi:hypothetical protein BU17DRAFT_79560 [Hysterangium stoloniferum]|nr:hypothetical protein BU17DRAFT_79560 [Hysterangium stoloniferum]
MFRKGLDRVVKRREGTGKKQSQPITNALHALTSTSGTSKATINSLPDEIMSKIFMLYLPQRREDWEPLDYEFCPRLGFGCRQYINEDRVILTHVTSRWRKLAISTPALWCTLHINRGLDIDAAQLKTWLQYSGDHPLDIYVRNASWHSTTLFSRMFLVVREELHRIRTFAGIAMYWDELAILFPTTAEPVVQLPMLEDFYIRTGTVRFWDSDRAAPCLGHIYAPILKYLDLGEAALLPCFMTTSFLPVKWAILVTGNYVVSPETVISFLACCPHLTSLNLITEVDLNLNIAPVWPQNRITLPSLRNFCFSGAPSEDNLLLVRSLRLPAVKRLELAERDSDYDVFRLELLWHLASEMDLTLEQIFLARNSIPVGPNILEPLLFKMSKLETVIMESLTLRPGLLEELIPRPGDPPEKWHLPRLKYLTFRNMDIEGTVIYRIMRSRGVDDATYEKLTDHYLNHKFPHFEGDKWIQPKKLKPRWPPPSLSLHEFLNTVNRLSITLVSCSFLDDETFSAMLELRRTHSRTFNVENCVDGN